MHLKARSWPYGAAESESAFKCLQISTSGAEKRIAVLWPPIGSELYALRTRIEVFRPIACVRRYNFHSRLLGSLIYRIFPIRTIGFYDDFGFQSPPSILAQASKVPVDFST